MLVAFVERGNVMAPLSRAQIFGIEAQFALYLVKAQSFNATMKGCDDLLDEDQVDMHPVIKERLAEMIGDADCNCKFKPAILRLAAGDDAGFRALDEPVNRTRAIIKTHRKQFDQRVEALAHPVTQIGPRHLREIEPLHMQKVVSHARNYVRRKARFLEMGDPVQSSEAILNDLLILALRALRSYYPFRSELHLLNTMRSTITNRGHSFIKANVADVRQRVVQNSDGTSYRREVSWVGTSKEGQPVLDVVSGDLNPLGCSALRLDLIAAARRGGPLGEVAAFILNPEQQDAFVSWLARVLPRCAGCSDVASAVAAAGRDYAFLIARFLDLPTSDTRKAFNQLKEIAL